MVSVPWRGELATLAARGGIESRLTRSPEHRRHTLITLGIICLIVAALFWSNPILWTIGVILVVLGVIFWIFGAMGRAIGGRRHYY